MARLAALRFYFDDEKWEIRYLVVNTGAWLSRREVLVSPIFMTHAIRGGHQAPPLLAYGPRKNQLNADFTNVPPQSRIFRELS